MTTIHKAKDNSLKLILGDHELFSEFLRDFIDVEREEIESIVKNIERKGIREMFAIENYDVQETRRVAKSEGKLEGKMEGKLEGKIEAVLNLVKNLKISVSEAMRVLELPEKEQQRVVKELKIKGIPYTLKN